MTSAGNEENSMDEYMGSDQEDFEESDALTK